MKSNRFGIQLSDGVPLGLKKSKWKKYFGKKKEKHESEEILLITY